MFDGDPQARAKDRDRDRAVYVVDAALRNRQISQQDRDLRVDRARAAHTIGELEALTRDLAAAPPPLPSTAVVPPVVTAPSPSSAPHPYGPVAQGPVAGVPADLYGPGPTATATNPTGAGLTTRPGAAGRRIALGCGALGLLFIVVPIVFGAVVFVSEGSGITGAEEDDPVTAGPPFELSGSGLREYVAAFGETFDDTEVVRTVFYDGYVVSWVPQDGSEVAIWNYVDGLFGRLGDPMEDALDTAPVDLAELKPAKVMSLVREAESLGVEGDVTTYVIYDRDVITDVPHVTVYVSNEEGESGYVVGDLNGHVLQTTTP